RPEAIAPLAALAVLDETVPGAAIETALRHASAARAAPLVAAQAAFQLARVLEQRGDAAGAAAARQPLRLFTHYWVVGQFGEGRGRVCEAVPPQTAPGGP